MIRFFRNLVGPSAVMAAGTMGAGAVASMLLASAWFGFSMLWVIVAMAPFFVASVNTAARIGAVNPGVGMMALIRSRIHPAVGWLILAVNIPVHFLVIMGQMSVMSASLASVFGIQLDGAASGAAILGEVALSLAIGGGILWLVLSRDYARMQNVMTGLMVVMFLCFLIVAVQGFQEIGQILMGFVPSLPADLAAPGQGILRSGQDTLIAVVGSAIAPAALLGMPYLAVDAGASADSFRPDMRRTIINLGVIFSAYAIFIMIAGGYALHSLPDHASIDSVVEAGTVMAAAFPEVLSGIGPLIFSLGLFFAALTTTVAAAQVTSYIWLDGIGKSWRFTEGNRGFFRLLAFFVIGPALLAPFWDFPALLKVVLLMGINVVVIPLVVAVVIFLSNSKAVMGIHVASSRRNAIMVALLIMTLVISAVKLAGYVADFQAM